MDNLRKVLATVLGGRAIVTVIGALFTPILVRLISQEEFGRYAVIISTFSVVLLITQLGFFDSVRKHLADHPDSREIQSRFVTAGLFIVIVSSTVVGGVALLLDIVGVIPNQYSRYTPVLIAGLFSASIFEIIRSSFYGIHLERASEALKSTRKILYSALALLLAYIGLDLYGVILSYTIAFLMISIVGLYYLQKHFFLKTPTQSLLLSNGKQLVTYGTIQLVGGLSAVLLYKTDLLLIEFFYGSKLTGLYNASLLPAEYLWFIPSVIQMIFLQRTASLYSSNSISKINEQIEEGLKYGILSITLFGVGLFHLSEPFLSVYFGRNYIDAALPLRILIIGTFFFGISRVLIPVFQATGWLKYTELVTLSSMIINIIFNLVLIPRFGIIGAAVGTSISYSCMLIGTILIWTRSEFSFPNMSFWASLLLPQSVFVIVYITIAKIIDIDTISALFFFPIFGLIIFTIINSYLGVISVGPAYRKIIDSI